MTDAAVERGRPTPLSKGTRDWLANKTIPNARAIAQDLEQSGEDVRDLLAAIDELETLLREGPRGARRRNATHPPG